MKVSRQLLVFSALVVLTLLFGCSAKRSAPMADVKLTAADLLGNPDYPAISYGGYRTNTRDVQPTLPELKEDLLILHAMGIRVLRTYNVHLAQASNLLAAIRELKQEKPDFAMYVMLGAWIDAKNAWTDQAPIHEIGSERNATEIDRAVELTKQYSDIVKVIAVGNEAMVKWATSYYVQPGIVLRWVNHLQGLKRAGELPADLWITSSDNFASWGGGGEEYHVPDLDALIRAVDYISVHTYPMHDTHYNPAFWGVLPVERDLSKEQKVKRAMLRAKQYAQSQYESVAAYLDRLGVDKPIHVGETGWASSSNGFYGQEGSLATDEYKQALYYEHMRDWSEEAGISVFYFEAFDEPWKDAGNPGGSENFFGLFTVDGKAKYALWPLVRQGVFEGLTRGGNPITMTYGGDREKLMADVAVPREADLRLPTTPLSAEVIETSAGGNQLEKRTSFRIDENAPEIVLRPGQEFQTITGIGGSFTEASAYLLNKLGDDNRKKIIEAYFGDEGARYSLTRTHMNSCDFSLDHYSYASVAGDTDLEHFSVAPDEDDLIPMIKDAMAVSTDGFKIISSPWTAPPWMKTNKEWAGGKLEPKYYDTWARFFVKYLEAYRERGIDIWGLTVENEPLGNDGNWESMHFTAEESSAFVREHLGPALEKDWSDVKLLGYDQNRGEELNEWVDAMYDQPATARYFDGTAVHWYASTFEVFPQALQYAHRAAPDKHLIQTEGCVDAEVPRWRDDNWYWSKEATDWGWDWAPAEQKHLHPKYVPVYRYARDMIGCFNNQVDGWIDWNMVLDRQGGPNWFENWCVAPVIVDPEADEVYFTPLYYTMVHFSKYIRPGAVRIGFEASDEGLQLTAVRNPDGSIAVVLLNQGDTERSYRLRLGEASTALSIAPRAVQTVLISPKN